MRTEKISYITGYRQKLTVMHLILLNFSALPGAYADYPPEYTNLS